VSQVKGKCEHMANSLRPYLIMSVVTLVLALMLLALVLFGQLLSPKLSPGGGGLQHTFYIGSPGQSQWNSSLQAASVHLTRG